MTTISVTRIPIRLEAIQWTGGNWPRVRAFAGDAIRQVGKSIGGKEALVLKLPTGQSTDIETGDYILKDERGLYVRVAEADLKRQFLEVRSEK